MSNATINTDNFTIINSASLKETIVKVQARVSVREDELKARLGKLPKEGLKSAAAAVLPGFLNTKLAG